MMITKGLLVRLMARDDKEGDVEAMLDAARPMVALEPSTTAWFALRLGRCEYGIVDVFPDEAARKVHLTGSVAETLMARSDELLTEPPRIEPFDVLAYKMPSRSARMTTKGLLLTFAPKTGNERNVADFLRDARPLVDDEPETLAWFAIHLDDGTYGIFDLFADSGGRLRHLVGQVPRELVRHSFELLGSFPHPDMVNVLGQNYAT